jgi:protoporphyrinogen/coproporphyrinogen III oxidase
MKTKHVVVIGAGISGLTAAFWLKQSGIPVTVLERDSVPGGTMRTTHEDGWLIETGPNSALETTPVIGEMLRILGNTGDRLYPDKTSDNRYIVRNGQLYPLPMSPPAFLKSRLWTVPGKLRLLKEPFIGRADREETIAEFVERRLGREFLDYAINPFVAGVYAGDPAQLSVRSAFPKLYALEEKYGGLIRGMIRGARERKKRAEVAKDRAKMFAFRNGMQQFPDAIAEHLGMAVQCNCTVTDIGVQPTQGGSGLSFIVDYTLGGRGSRLEASDIILAIPAYAAAELLQAHSSALAEALRGIYYPPVAEVYLGYKAEQCGRPLDGFGFLVPAIERRKILGTIWSSALFPGRAPSGHVALTTFVGGSRQPEMLGLPDAELLNAVRGELDALMAVRGEPAFAKVIRWDRAIPQYNLGHGKIMAMVDALEASHPGLIVCSNYRGGIAVGDCVRNGREAAARVERG